MTPTPKAYENLHKLTIRLQKSVVIRLKIHAAKTGKSLQELVEAAVVESLKGVK
jgi:predicted HicB family RNase H-like nuclease